MNKRIKYKYQEPVPFGESLIWQLQRDYFNEMGVEAWRLGQVPHYITSNAFIARKYAEQFLAFTRDRLRMGYANERFYLLEPGAGSGRFAYHFLKELEHLQVVKGYEIPDYCYVMSDIAASNLEFWKQHPRLQPYIAAKQLDVALYDATMPENIVLQISGEILQNAAGSVPLVVIANYFFDGIPQQLIEVKDQQLSLIKLKLETKIDPENKSAAEILENLIPTYEEEPIKKPLFEEDYLNALLESYRHSKLNTNLLFPESGLRMLHKLRQQFAGGFMLLSADKGYHRLEELDGFQPPRLVTHGSFSLTVNYHALAEYVRMQGGRVLSPNHVQRHINVQQMLLTENPEAYQQTAGSYRAEVQDFGPDEYYSVRQVLTEGIPKAGIPELLAAMRYTCYDPQLFRKMIPRLTELFADRQYFDRNEVLRTCATVWDNYYPLGEDQDLAFQIGTLLFNYACYPEALRFYGLSEQIYGFQLAVGLNQALCYIQMNETDAARKPLQELKIRYPQDPQIDALLQELPATRARSFHGIS